jgi:hypothetical protein
MLQRRAPVEGLPALLPRGETLLWQGSPCWKTFARTAFFGDWIAAYFAALVIWRVVDGAMAGAPWDMIAVRAAALAMAGVVALGVVGLLAWISAKRTVYSITNRRVALKIGVALIVIANVPFKRIASATLRNRGGGKGDIALEIGGGDRFAYLVLWPHARPWRLVRPQPTLRAVPEAAKVAAKLGEALRGYQAEFGIDAPVAQKGRAPQTVSPSGMLAPAD